MDTFGTITFQANNSKDIFYKTLTPMNDKEDSDEEVLGIEDTQFDSNFCWVMGKVPKFLPVQVEGDTTVIHAWFQSQVFLLPFTLRVYVECEMQEELIEVEAEEEVIDEDRKEDLEPQEIHL